MIKTLQDVVLAGSSLSEGVAIGQLYFLADEPEITLPSFSIHLHEVDREIQRYRQALSSSRKDLEQLQLFLVAEGSNEAIGIIDTHIQMLEDPLMTTIVEEKIQQMLLNTESVFRSVIGDYEKKFISIEDEFFKQRWVDVKDLSHRILKHLYPKNQQEKELPKEAILFAKEFTPSLTVEGALSKVGAFLAEIGGETSHAALIARANGIPFVAHLDMDLLKKAEGTIVIVDGLEGKVILFPSDETIHHYKSVKKDLFENDQRLVEELFLESKTKDGRTIHLYTNVDKLSDLDHEYFQGSEGIGLFRSEFLFLQHEILSISEQEQYIYYCEMIKKAKDLPIVFRVFDLGGDKGLLTEKNLEEPNPALGCRGIRFLLYYKQLFKKQLRAILRAAYHGNVSLLFPLIADVEELKEVKRMLLEVEKELENERVVHAKKIPVGCMIEVPSAVLTSDILADESDFFSIGTNDLVQYTLAIDRCHPILNQSYRGVHPSIIRMLRDVVDVGVKKGIKVSVCGEMASNPLFTELLIGLGIEALSCPPRHIPMIKKRIRSTNYAFAKDLSKKILDCKTSSEIEEHLLKTVLATTR